MLDVRLQLHRLNVHRPRPLADSSYSNYRQYDVYVEGDMIGTLALEFEQPASGSARIHPASVIYRSLATAIFEELRKEADDLASMDR